LQIAGALFSTALFDNHYFRGLLCEKVELKFDFIRREKKAYPATLLCEVALKVRITAIFKKHRGQYGSRRILKQLKNEGHQIGRHKARRLMRELGLRAKAPKRYKITTDSQHSFPVAPNILNRKFDVDKLNTFWTANITYVWTLEDGLSLSVAFGLYSRQIVGWAMDKRMKKHLTLDVLAMAYWRRKPPVGRLFIIRTGEASMHVMITEND
jgi:transposase InsO family protein